MVTPKNDQTWVPLKSTNYLMIIFPYSCDGHFYWGFLGCVRSRLELGGSAWKMLRPSGAAPAAS